VSAGPAAVSATGDPGGVNPGGAGSASSIPGAAGSGVMGSAVGVAASAAGGARGVCRPAGKGIGMAVAWGGATKAAESPGRAPPSAYANKDVFDFLRCTITDQTLWHCAVSTEQGSFRIKDR
jgi:hypothetical protein